MMRHIKLLKIFLIIVILSSVIGCVRLQVSELNTYDKAMQMSGPARPKLLMDITKVKSAMSAYAIINANAGTAVSQETIIRKIWHKAAELKADVVLIQNGGDQYAGSVATGMYVGSGISTAVASPVYQRVVRGVCLRLNPAKIGFQTDNNRMITVINNDSELVNAGIMEGDTVLSINDFAWTPTEPMLDLLSLSPSQDVKITVIRPGAGRIVKSIKTLTNPPVYLDQPDAISWEEQYPKR